MSMSNTLDCNYCKMNNNNVYIMICTCCICVYRIMYINWCFQEKIADILSPIAKVRMQIIKNPDLYYTIDHSEIFGVIWDKFAIIFASIFSGTEPSSAVGAIWDEFSEQH